MLIKDFYNQDIVYKGMIITSNYDDNNAEYVEITFPNGFKIVVYVGDIYTPIDEVLNNLFTAVNSVQTKI